MQHRIQSVIHVIQSWLRTRRPLAIGLASGLVSVVLAWLVLDAARESAREDGLRQAQQALSATPSGRGASTRSVVVAQRPLDTGMSLAVEHLALRELPSAWLSEEHLDEKNLDAHLAKALRRPIAAGDPIRLSDLQQPWHNSATHTDVSKGHRLVTLQAGSGWQAVLRDGDLIDIYEIETLPTIANDGSGIQRQATVGGAGPSARLIAAAVRSRQLQQPKQSWVGSGSATSHLMFEIPNSKVARVLAAQSRGQLHLAWRSSNEPGTGDTAPARPGAAPDIEVLLHQTQPSGE